MFVSELFVEDVYGGPKLIAIFRKEKPHHAKIYLWKTGPGDNTYEMEVGQDRKRIPVALSFAQIRQTLARKGFNESITRAGRILIEASMTKSVPSKKEGVFNKGVEKSLGQQVAVIVLDHPDSVGYGKFVRIGETGLCHIKLNGGKLPGWASGDMIAVRPSEVYSTWDPRLQGKNVVHREYDDVGRKITREEGNDNVDVTTAMKHFSKARHYEQLGHHDKADKHYAAADKIMGQFNWRPEKESRT